jgi:hypothetical protein
MKQSGFQRTQGTLFTFLLVVICSVGCSGLLNTKRERKYSTINPTPESKAEHAKELNQQGSEALLAGDLKKAEKYFSDALAEDTNYAAAHNNLGQVYLKQHRLYLAAWEFEFAANLLIDRIEPRINLGLVYETAQQFDDALRHYEIAFDMAPTNPAVLSNLTRVLVKLDSDRERIGWLLRQITLYDERPEWTCWAMNLLATRYRIEPAFGTVGASASAASQEFDDDFGKGGEMKFPPGFSEELPVPNGESSPHPQDTSSSGPTRFGVPFLIESSPLEFESIPLDKTVQNPLLNSSGFPVVPRDAFRSEQ